MSDALRPNSEVIDASGQMLFSEVPQTVCFEPLYTCNIKCKYCYIGQEKNTRTPVVPPLELTLRILKQMHEDGVKEVYLAGGEPLTHPNFKAICEYMADIQFEHRGVITNGILIDDDIAQLLKRCGFWVNVTFRGSTADIFDDITTIKGSFRRTLQGLQCLQQAGINPGIELDPIPANYRYVKDMIHLLLSENIRVREVWIHRIAPFGDAEDKDDFTMSLDDYKAVLLQAKAIQDEYGVATSFEDGLPLCLFEEELHPYIIPCACGITSATIDPFGNFRRCACHPKQFGNILKTSFKKLWIEELGDFRSLTWLNPLCKNCGLLGQCGGGCSVTARSEAGHAKDRFAEYFVPVDTNR